MSFTLRATRSIIRTSPSKRCSALVYHTNKDGQHGQQFENQQNRFRKKKTENEKIRFVDDEFGTRSTVESTFMKLKDQFKSCPLDF